MPAGKKFHDCKMIVLDFDGTIVDSMPWLEQIAVQVMSKYMNESRAILRKKYRETTGLPFEQQIELIRPNHPENRQMVKEFEETKKKYFHSQKLFKDTISTLKYLKQQNYKLALSSGTFDYIIEPYLEARDILHFFDDILGYRPGFEKGKDHFHYLMNKYQLSPSELVFIGDSLNDARRALSNHIHFIAKLGLFTREEFAKIDGDLIFITKLEELRQIL